MTEIKRQTRREKIDEIKARVDNWVKHDELAMGGWDDEMPSQIRDLQYLLRVVESLMAENEQPKLNSGFLETVVKYFQFVTLIRDPFDGKFFMMAQPARYVRGRGDTPAEAFDRLLEAADEYRRSKLSDQE